MATDTINISVDDLRRVGAEFRSASEQSLATVSRLQRAVQSLDGQWSGYAQQRFFQEHRQWELMMRQFAELLEGVGGQLEAIATDFADADRQAGRKFG